MSEPTTPKEYLARAGKTFAKGIAKVFAVIMVLFAVIWIGGSLTDGNPTPSVKYSSPTKNSLSADQNLSVWLKANSSDKDLLCSLMVKKIDASITANNLCSCISEVSTGNNLNLSIAETAASCAIILMKP